MFQSPCAAFVASLSLCLAVGQLRLATAYYHGEPGGLSQNGKKSHASIKTMSASASSSRPSKMRYSPNFERTDDDELTYQFGVNTRSTSGNGVSGDESTDSCHLSIECNGTTSSRILRSSIIGNLCEQTTYLLLRYFSRKRQQAIVGQVANIWTKG